MSIYKVLCEVLCWIKGFFLWMMFRIVIIIMDIWVFVWEYELIKLDWVKGLFMEV